MFSTFLRRQPNHTASSVFFYVLLIALSSSYTLDGQWQLTTKQLLYTQSNPNVIFQFVNNIVTPSLALPRDLLGSGSTLPSNPTNQQLTIYACKTLTYNYWVDEKSIYFSPIQTSSLSRACQINELE